MDSTLFAFLYLMFFTYGILKITLYQWTKILLLFTATQYSTVWMYNNLCKQSCGWKANVFLNGVSMSDSVIWLYQFSSVQFSSVAQSCPNLCDPMNRSTPGLPVHHHLPEFTQTQVHWVRDAIQPSHPRSSLSPIAPNPSQHQSFPMSQLFPWGGQSTGASASASFPPKKSQGWSPSEWTGWISLKSKGLSRVFSNTTVRKHQFFGSQPSSQSNSHIHTWLQEKP